ncbi:uncharacterized protein LOC141817023 [Curcuma longa]|uniref:uncharacterized protein LOC141817023 n=1 Tax=Curcuma longa TaxID=136217 RepID=UPI003D9F1390
MQQAFTSVYYPQSNGQTKVINRELVKGLKTKLDHVGGSWVDELPDILWAYQNYAPRQHRVDTISSGLRREAVVPVEIGCHSIRIATYDNPEENAVRRAAELDLITETRDKTNARLDAYRRRMGQMYNRRVRLCSFYVGDFVWKRRTPMEELGKLEPKWQGPYQITDRLAGGSYYLVDLQHKVLPRPWHATVARCPPSALLHLKGQYPFLCHIFKINMHFMSLFTHYKHP